MTEHQTTSVAHRDDAGQAVPAELRTAIERDRMIREAAAVVETDLGPYCARCAEEV